MSTKDEFYDSVSHTIYSSTFPIYQGVFTLHNLYPSLKYVFHLYICISSAGSSSKVESVTDLIISYFRFILLGFKLAISFNFSSLCSLFFDLRTLIGVETAALTFRTKQYSTSYSSHICYGKRFYNDFFLNHHTIALVNNCLKLLSCVVIETALDLVKKRINYLNSLLSTRKLNILTSSRTVF